jgi:hypothetical protein
MDTTEGARGSRPLLFIDVDGVISLFGFGLDLAPQGRFQTVDGVAHFISGSAGHHLLALRARFELVWCTGWEEKANEYLPHLLGLPGPLPYLTFETHYARSQAPPPAPAWSRAGPPPAGAGPGARPGPAPGAGRHWKLDAIEAHAGPRPLAWIDDGHTEECQAWATARSAPTLLVSTEPSTGLGVDHVQNLAAWARALDGDAAQRAGAGKD